jgi:Beta/Gamma crystallin
MNAIFGIRRIEFLTACALFASGAAAAELTLYADSDYQGRALSVVIDERQLGVRSFDDRASSVVIESSAWILCSDEDFGGRCITLEPGRYASLQALGLNDAVTSVRRRDPASVGIFTGPRDAPGIVLFAGSEYRGASRAIDQPQSDLRALSLNGEATSAVIASGEWELCRDAQFRGPCVILGPGKYPSLSKHGLEPGATSVRRAAVASHQQEEDPPAN